METRDGVVSINGKRVKELRMGMKMSMQDLGDKVGMTKQGIGRIESGKPMINVRDRILKNLSVALECTPDYLLGRVDEVRGVLHEEDMDKPVRINPVIKRDLVEGLTERVWRLGKNNAEILNTTLSILENISVEEQRLFRAYLNSLSAYKKYTERLKSFPERIIDTIYKKDYMIKLYAVIYDQTSVDKISYIRRCTEDETAFASEMQKEYGNKILHASNEVLKDILDDVFKEMYKQNRVKKGPLSRKLKLYGK